MRHIDHLVVAVHDLDAAAAFYQSLGFQVDARNRHPWGTENRIIQFPGAFIELITAPAGADIPPHQPGEFSFGAFVRDYLERREGLAMLVLGSADAVQDAERFAKLGIGSFAPFRFERSGTKPDGTATHVAFSLAFAQDANAPELGFFVCQQHYPEAFWNEKAQQHPNGASSIAAVDVTTPQPDTHRAFLSAFADTEPVSGHVPLDGGMIHIRSGHVPVFDGYSITVSDLDALAAHLAKSGIPARVTPQEIRIGDDLGTVLTFVPSRGLAVLIHNTGHCDRTAGYVANGTQVTDIDIALGWFAPRDRIVHLSDIPIPGTAHRVLSRAYGHNLGAR